MGKIVDKFKELSSKKEKASIAYLTFGFPSISFTKDIIIALQKSPVNIIEVGVPFSDPLADGPILQEASRIALANGADTNKLFSTIKFLKDKVKTPIVIMTYYNPVYRFGVNKFIEAAKDAGVGGIMVVDLPIEEASSFVKKSRRADIDTIFFVTPETSNERIKEIVKLSRGFIYYISVTGITGPKKLSFDSIARDIKRINKFGHIPVCVGFGIHKKSQVEKMLKISDGVIVGSALAKFINNNYKDKDFLNKLDLFLRRLYG